MCDRRVTYHQQAHIPSSSNPLRCFGQHFTLCRRKQFGHLGKRAAWVIAGSRGQRCLQLVVLLEEMGDGRKFGHCPRRMDLRASRNNHKHNCYVAGPLEFIVLRLARVKQITDFAADRVTALVVRGPES